MPTEDQEAISKVVGKPILLNEYDADGRAELKFTDSNGVIHFIYVKTSFVRAGYALVGGARRNRASELACRESIPATLRELTDGQALELQIISNVPRVTVHPLDEAQG